MANKQIIYIDDVVHEIRESKVNFTGVSEGAHVLKIESYDGNTLLDTKTRNITVVVSGGLLTHDHYFTFDESSGDLIDQTGSADGTLNGSIVRDKTGVLGTAYGFNGSNTYVSVPNLVGDFTGSFSVGVWAKFNSSPSNYFRLAHTRGGGSLGGKKGWQLSGRNDNYSNTVIDDGKGNYITFDTVPFNEADGEFHFFVLTFDITTGTAKLYIDAVLQDTKTNSAFINADTTSSDTFEFGRNSAGSQYFNGDLDEAYIYMGVWSQQELTDYFNSITA